MSGFDRNFPADNEYLADFPSKQRQNQEVLIDGQIVNAGSLNGYKQGNKSGNIPISNGTVNSNLNADMLDGKHSTDFAESGHSHNTATTSSAGFMSATQAQKLDSIATNAEVNQNAFSNVVVGSSTIQADNATDTLKMIAGTNIAISADTTNDAVTISVSGTVAKASKDGDGNVITSTYATKNEVNTTVAGYFGNQANKSPVFSSEGHLILPSGIEIW